MSRVRLFMSVLYKSPLLHAAAVAVVLLGAAYLAHPAIERSGAYTAIADLLGASRYAAHSICLSGDALMANLFVLTDGLIGAAYLFLATALYTAYRNKALVIRVALVLLNDPVFLKLFAAFIFWCACTHLTMIMTLYQGVYVLDIMARCVTAGVSVATAARVGFVALRPHKATGLFDELLSGPIPDYEPRPLSLPNSALRQQPES